MTEPYFIRPGYTPRLEPDYFVDEELNAVWQPDLYPDAATIARRLGRTKIVDVGCGTASKLAPLHPEFEIVGIDYGSNIERAREAYPWGTWIETDLDRADDLGYADVGDSVLVCGDVIEHLVTPERLLGMLRDALDRGAAALLLTTPDRELTSNPEDLGPPANPAHVREWTRAELGELLAASGLEAHVGLTRSNDVMPYMRTTLALVPGGDAATRESLASWWEERARWERLAVDQDRIIAEQAAWITELDAAKTWFQERAESQSANRGALRSAGSRARNLGRRWRQKL